MPQTILVTGGAGFIGSHTCLALLESGDDVVVVDDFSNSSAESIRRVEALAGRSVPVYAHDLRDRARLRRIFADHAVDAVVHCAGKKAVGESVERPLDYYENNLGATFALLDAMLAHGVDRIVFSSSATVYGTVEEVPIRECAPLRPVNPYGRTKLMIERVLEDVACARPDFRALSLRYFNPAGAHESGRIGEDPQGRPNNLMPLLTRVAMGRMEYVPVFGADYPTRDGTGVRDYIHVVDVARGHVAAIRASSSLSGHHVCNLGTGTGTSVMELLDAMSAVVGRELPRRVVARRPGDVAESFADATRALALLGWRAERTIADMCRDAWAWQSANPHGYDQREG